MSRKIRLLVVDDEVQFLNALSQRLILRDFEVAKAANGQDAARLVRAEKFDLAILDLKMPGMGGVEVLQMLKRKHKYLEVIILTGHGSFDSAVECAKQGAFGYLPKPYEMEHLIRILKDAYEARLKKKFQADQEQMARILKIAAGNSPLPIMHALRELDDEIR
jgi:DNA-binding NtrC family response regulator